MDVSERARTARRVAGRLLSLGVPVCFSDTPHPRAFLPGVWIDRGQLCVCPAFAAPGDVLHEAGHLAIVPARFRVFIEPGPILCENNALACALLRYLHGQELWEIPQAERLARLSALAHLDDYEAIAWAYAAATAIGFSARQAFVYEYPGVPQDQQPYQGDGADTYADLALRRDHPGIAGLVEAGLCESAEAYPRLRRWMQT